MGGDRVAARDTPPPRSVARQGARWLEVGGPRYSRGRHRPKRADRWRWYDLLGLALGGLGLVLGAGLALSPSPTAIGLTASGYQIGSLVLPSQGGGVYEDGVVVLLAAPKGQAAGAADGYLGQLPFSGKCLMAATSEQCAFTVNGHSLTAHDVLAGHRGALEWLRIYSTGQHLAIPLIGSPVPVPLPLGSPGQ